MKNLSMLLVLSSLIAATSVLASGPDPIPWPHVSPVAVILASGPDPIPWPTPPKHGSLC
jgi:hypothetical protein